VFSVERAIVIVGVDASEVDLVARLAAVAEVGQQHAVLAARDAAGGDAPRWLLDRHLLVVAVYRLLHVHLPSISSYHRCLLTSDRDGILFQKDFRMAGKDHPVLYFSTLWNFEDLFRKNEERKIFICIHSINYFSGLNYNFYNVC
jgi:hypothetical protein